MEDYKNLLKEIDNAITISASNADWEFKHTILMNKYYKVISPMLADLNLSIDYDDCGYSSFKDMVEAYTRYLVPIRANLYSILNPPDECMGG